MHAARGVRRQLPNIAMDSRRPSRTSRTLRRDETIAAVVAESQPVLEYDFAGAHLARRPRAPGTTYYGTADNLADVGVGEANHLASLSIAETRLGQRAPPWPPEALLADAAIAEALLAVEVPPDDVPVGYAMGVPVSAASASAVAGPVMGIAVDPTNHRANQQAYYDAYYNAYYNANNNRPANDPANDMDMENMREMADMLSRVAMENVATRLNTVGITYLRSDVGITDPEVSPMNGQRAFRAMLRGNSRGQDNRRPRICVNDDDWRRHCPWAARLRRMERLTEQTERLLESVERL